MTVQQNYPEAQLEIKGKRQSYSGSFKAQVVTEWINRKRTLAELAECYNIHPNQIKNWKSLLLREAKNVLEDKRREKLPGKKGGKYSPKDVRGNWHADTSGSNARINIPS